MVTPDDIGKPVSDGVRTGILMEIYKDWTNPNQSGKDGPMAFVRPEGGGYEWSVQPGRLEPL
ncbi:hypothetical protein [Streptomyces sp. NPDC055099]